MQFKMKKFLFDVLAKLILMSMCLFDHVISIINPYFLFDLIWEFSLKLIEKCWTNDPNLRPIPRTVLKELERINPVSGESLAKVVTMVKFFFTVTICVSFNALE